VNAGLLVHPTGDRERSTLFHCDRHVGIVVGNCGDPHLWNHHSDLERIGDCLCAPTEGPRCGSTVLSPLQCFRTHWVGGRREVESRLARPVNWRQFLKSNEVILLTLPGVLLCSLPLSVIGWGLIDGAIPISVSNFLKHQFITPAAYVLAPVTMVCSTLAMVRIAEGSGKLRPLATLLLCLFNSNMLVASLMVIGYM